MPNVANPEAVTALAQRVGKRITDAKVASRFERMAIRELMQDPRSFRAASPLELDALPVWAKQAHARGETVSIFAPKRGSKLRLSIAAGRLDAACQIANTDPATRPEDASRIERARVFLTKLDRMNLNAAKLAAYTHQCLLRAWQDERDDQQHYCDPGTIEIPDGHRWIRIRSLGELRKVGREFGNCLAQASLRSSYGASMARSRGEFWVLRDADGKGLIVAHALLAPSRLVEVKGPRNAAVPANDPRVMALADSLGIQKSAAAGATNDLVRAQPREALTLARTRALLLASLALHPSGPEP